MAAWGPRSQRRSLPRVRPLVYKSLPGVALPRWAAGAPFDPLMTSFAWTMGVGVVLDLLIMPWSSVVAYYVRAPGDAWRRRPGGVTAGS